MKILIAMPHFYRGDGISRHASLRSSGRDDRLHVFEDCLRQIYVNWIGRKLLIRQHLRDVVAAEFRVSVDLVVVINEDHHFLYDQQAIPDDAFSVVRMVGNPLHLGFAAHQVLANAAASDSSGYDFFGFMEDDLIIEDRCYFDKLSFANNHIFKDRGKWDFVIQPNRFEVPRQSRDGFCGELYIDFATADAPENDYSVNISWSDSPVEIAGTTHPHAGCFFLNKKQMERILGKENFGTPSRNWVTWLDTAATFAIASNFKVLKPSFKSIDWLNVRHASNNHDNCLRHSKGALPYVSFGNPNLALRK